MCQFTLTGPSHWPASTLHSYTYTSRHGSALSDQFYFNRYLDYCCWPCERSLSPVSAAESYRRWLKPTPPWTTRYLSCRSWIVCSAHFPELRLPHVCKVSYGLFYIMRFKLLVFYSWKINTIILMVTQFYLRAVYSWILNAVILTLINELMTVC